MNSPGFYQYGRLSMIVRRAVTADRGVARKIVDEYAAAVGVLVRDDDTTFDVYFARRGGLWLAEDADRVAGCVALRPLVSIAPDAAEIKRLYVRPERRGAGVATILMNALESAAFADGYRTIYLDSHEGLVDALRFYGNRGYTAIPRYNDNPQATVFLARSLTHRAD